MRLKYFETKKEKLEKLYSTYFRILHFFLPKLNPDLNFVAMIIQ